MGARRHSGLVLNVSPRGLFVQTHAKPTSGETIRVALNVPGSSETMALDATVVWKRVVPAGLLRVAQGGVGLQLTNPPEGYYRLLADVVRVNEQKPEVSASSPPRESNLALRTQPPPATAVGENLEAGAQSDSYKVRVSLGQRSRIVTVSAPSETRAREIALERVGEGWKVIGSERAP